MFEKEGLERNRFEKRLQQNCSFLLVIMKTTNQCSYVMSSRRRARTSSAFFFTSRRVLKNYLVFYFFLLLHRLIRYFYPLFDWFYISAINLSFLTSNRCFSISSVIVLSIPYNPSCLHSTDLCLPFFSDFQTLAGS